MTRKTLEKEKKRVCEEYKPPRWQELDEAGLPDWLQEDVDEGRYRYRLRWYIKDRYNWMDLDTLFRMEVEDNYSQSGLLPNCFDALAYGCRSSRSVTHVCKLYDINGDSIQFSTRIRDSIPTGFERWYKEVPKPIISRSDYLDPNETYYYFTIPVKYLRYEISTYPFN